MHFSEYDTRLAAYALIVRDSEVLLAWYNGRGMGRPGWSLPGGGVEYDESLEAACIRECHEETGYDVALGQILVLDHQVTSGSERLAGHTHRPMKSQRVVFEGTVVGGTLGTLEVDGTTDYARWFRLAEVPDLPRVSIVDLALAAFLDA